jgi:hypothetical protein
MASDPSSLMLVIPAKAGIHFAFDLCGIVEKSKWIPACAGMTEYVVR